MVVALTLKKYIEPSFEEFVRVYYVNSMPNKQAEFARDARQSISSSVDSHFFLFIFSKIYCQLLKTMASSVFYKFNSRKDESRVTFAGTGISVFDLKREIILANNMGKANDFDLFIYDTTSMQGECCHSWFVVST